MAELSLPGFVLGQAVAQSSGVKGSRATRIGIVAGLFGTSPIGILLARSLAQSEGAKAVQQPVPPKGGKPLSDANNVLVAEHTGDVPQPSPATTKRAS